MVSPASRNHSKVGAGGGQPLRCRLHRCDGWCSGPGEKPQSARVETKRGGREMWCRGNDCEARNASRLCG